MAQMLREWRFILNAMTGCFPSYPEMREVIERDAFPSNNVEYWVPHQLYGQSSER